MFFDISSPTPISPPLSLSPPTDILPPPLPYCKLLHPPAPPRAPPTLALATNIVHRGKMLAPGWAGEIWAGRRWAFPCRAQSVPGGPLPWWEKASAISCFLFCPAVVPRAVFLSLTHSHAHFYRPLVEQVKCIVQLQHRSTCSLAHWMDV